MRHFSTVLLWPSGVTAAAMRADLSAAAIVRGCAAADGRLARTVSEDSLPSDGDGQPDAIDNCPYEPNPLQGDAGGLGVGSAPDGIGDACQRGDVTGDGRVTSADSAVILRPQLVPPTATVPQQCAPANP